MEINYTMIGGDGSHYGPVSLEQIKSWISEGRVTGETKIRRSDTNSWLPASQYTELGVHHEFPTAATATSQVPRVPAPAMMAGNPILERRVKQSANWFYWIAALSAVNTFISYTGSSSIRFAVGLGVTTKINMLAYEMNWDRATALALNVLAAGVFALFGVFAGMRQNWSFIVGMILYAIDGYLCLTTMNSLFMLGFHAFVLFCIFKGLQANLLLQRETR